MNEIALREMENEIDRIIYYYNIDVELFKKKLADRLLFVSLDNVKDKKQYLLSIIRKMIKDENLENTYQEEKDGVTIIDLVNRMRNLGIQIDPNETLLLDLYFDEVKKYLSAKDIKLWVNACIGYLINNKSVKFSDMFKRTKTMRDLNLDYGRIENEYNEQIK